MAGTITRRKVTRADLAQWDGRNATVSSIDATGGTVTGLAVGNEIDVLQVFGSGTSRTSGTINAALQYIGSTVCAIVFAPGTWSISENVTVPSNVFAHIPAGCIFSVDAGITLTFSSPVAVEYPASWTSGSGTVSATSYFGHLKTAAELAAGLTIVDGTKPPGYSTRYGTNTTPGTTNMSTAIQAALNSGAPVVIDGENAVSTALSATATAAFTIKGINGGKITSTVVDAADYSAVLTINGTSSTRLRIRDLDISHSGTGSTLDGLKVTNAAIAHFDNFRVSGARYWGSEVVATQQTHVNCRYFDNVHGGVVPSGGTITFVGTSCVNNGNSSDNTTGYGCVISGTDAHIFGGIFSDNDRYGLDLRYAGNATVENCYVYNSGYVGIYGVNEDATKDAANIKLINCTVDMNDRVGSSHAIWLGSYGAGSTASAGEMHVRGCTIKNSLDDGILVGSGSSSYTVTDAVVEGNSISEVDGEAIYIGGTTAIPNVVVRGNSLRNTGEVLVSGVTNAVISDNTAVFTGTKSRMFYCSAANASIHDNIADGTISGLGIEYVVTGNLSIGGNSVGT